MISVNKLGIHAGLKKEDFRLIAHGGFNDGMNAYAHSMGWFNGHLYVATTRGNFPLMKARLVDTTTSWESHANTRPIRYMSKLAARN